MPHLPAPFRMHGGQTRKEQNRQADRDRGSARARGYTTAWDKAAKGHLRHEPLCRYCAEGAFGEPPRDTAATLVDHLFPHNGDQVLFWTTWWWVSSCRPCHDGPKQALERQGLPALDRLAATLGLRPRD